MFPKLVKLSHTELHYQNILTFSLFKNPKIKVNPITVSMNVPMGTDVDKHH